MPRKYSAKKSKKSFLLIVSLFFFLSLPLISYTLLERNLDTRSKAFDRLELSDKNPCIISLPNVNPYTLEVGKSVRIQVDAKYTNSGIQKLNIIDSTGDEIYSEEFPNAPLQIGTSFAFTPSKSGTIDLLGTIEKTGGGSAACKISSPYDIKGIRAIANNASPEFTSQPKSSKPGQDIKTGVQYEYNLTAEDADKDRINYFYSFTPRADWLKAVIIKDGSSGELSVTFRGTTDKPASYLAHVVIHDGYSMHVRTQSWVISVSPAENDMPILRIIDPLSSIRIDSGEKFDTSWNVSDLNHVSKFQLYMAKNPSDEGSWVKVGNDLEYNVSKTAVETKGLPSGTYKLVIKATDNQTPPKSGIGVSPEIIISKLSDKDKGTDDEIVLPEAQVINMSPDSKDLISNSRVTIKGTIIASEDADINESSIVFKIDDKNVTKEIKINKISEREYTLIYQPSEDLKDGIHKAEISFSDTKDKEGSKSWEFTINSNTDDNSEVYVIFGKEISKRTMLIIGMGFLLIILAICVPLLISLIWGTNKKQETSTLYTSRNIPEDSDFENQAYIPPSVDVNIRDKVEDIETELASDDSDMYSVGKFDEEIRDEEIQKDIVVKKEFDVEEPEVKIEDTKEYEFEKEITIKPEEVDEEPKLEIDTGEIKPEIEVEETVFASKVFKPEVKEEEIEEPETIKPEKDSDEPVFAPKVFKPDVKEEVIEEPSKEIEEPVIPIEEKIELPKFVSVETSEDQEVIKPTETIDETATETETQDVNPPVVIEEPEAPDPSIFQQIATQIEAQTTEEDSTTNDETNQ